MPRCAPRQRGARIETAYLSDLVRRFSDARPGNGARGLKQSACTGFAGWHYDARPGNGARGLKQDGSLISGFWRQKMRAPATGRED